MRELRNVLEQAVLLHPGQAIAADQLALSRRGLPVTTATPVAPEETLPEVERRALLQALESNAWNVSRAARVLGISRDTLRYRIEKFELNAPEH